MTNTIEQREPISAPWSGRRRAQAKSRRPLTVGLLVIAGSVLPGCEGRASIILPDASNAVDAPAATTSDTGLDAAPDAAPDGGQPTGRPGRADRPFECPATAPIADVIAFSPARPVVSNACTEPDLRRVRALFATGTPDPDQLAAELTPDCSACVTSYRGDTAWGPLVYEYMTPHPYFTTNTAGCLQAAGLTECARAVSDLSLCVVAACDGCTSSQLNPCVDTQSLYAPTGACGAYMPAYNRCDPDSAGWNDCVMPTSGNADFYEHLVRFFCGPPG